MLSVGSLVKELQKLPQDALLVIGKKGDKDGRMNEQSYCIEPRKYGFGDNDEVYFALCPDKMYSNGTIKRILE